MQKVGRTTDLNQFHSDGLYYEECRPMIVRELVYDGSAVTSTAKLFGAQRSALMAALRSWKVHIPGYISPTQHQTWFRRKTETGKGLPKPLLVINRSEFVSMWQMWDWESLCVIWGVGEATMESALAFHCIVCSGLDRRASVFLSGEPTNKGSGPPNVHDDCSS